MDPKIVTMPLSEIIPMVREIINTNQTIEICVTGESMRPFLWENDIVELGTMNRKPRKGDIILTETPDDSYILHRIYQIDNEKLQTLGDAEYSLDEQVDINAIIAEAISVKRGKKHHELNIGICRFLGLIWLYMYPLRRLIKRIRYKLRR